MEVVYSASRNLYPYLYPSIISLLEHNDVECIYLLLEDDRFPANLPKLPKECVIINISEQRWFETDGANFRTRFTYLSLMRATYSKLFRKVKKILQLDVDTIVTDSLQPIWDIDISNAYFAAVPEHLTKYEPDFDLKGKYFNIGVAVFNLEKIRKDKVDDKIIKDLNTIPFKYIDQDVWNKYGSETAVELPVRYNETFVTGYTDNPAVVHFAGKKNWYMSPEDMFRHEYLDKYLKSHAEISNMIDNLRLKDFNLDV